MIPEMQGGREGERQGGPSLQKAKSTSTLALFFTSQLLALDGHGHSKNLAEAWDAPQ